MNFLFPHLSYNFPWKIDHEHPVYTNNAHLLREIMIKIYNIYYYNINLLVSGLHKIHIISNTVFHAARNLQGDGVDVAVVRIELEKYEAGRRGRGWIKGGQAI